MNTSKIAKTNIQKLARIDPELSSQLQEFLQEQREKRVSPRFDFIVTRSGELTVQSKTNSPRWIHDQHSPAKETERLVKQHIREDTKILIIWKAGLGYVIRAIQDRGIQKKLIVVESRLELLWEWICRWDCQYLFEDPDVLFLFGERAEQNLLTLIKTYPKQFPSSTLVIPGCHLDTDEKQEMQRIEEAIRDSQDTIVNIKRDKKRFVIMSHTIPEMNDAIQRGIVGNHMIPFEAQRNPRVSRFWRDQDIWKETCGCVPGIAFCFYGSIFSSKELKSMANEGVKRVVWYYDTPQIKHDDLGECYDLALVFDSSHLPILKPYFGSRCRYLAPATAFDTFRPKGFVIKSPVNYVGATGYRLSLPYLQQNPKIAPKLVNTIRKVIRSSLGKNAHELQKDLYKATREFFDEVTAWTHWLVLQIATSEIRIAFLQSAQPFGLTIYGDALWGESKLVGELTSSYAGTSLDYATQTPEIYAASPINVHLCHPQVVHGNPIRVYDVLACGGFLLAEYRPCLEEHFTIGMDLDVFHTPEELKEKIVYYLTHQEQRNEIANHGQHTVLENHTYQHRIKDMLSILNETSSITIQGI